MYDPVITGDLAPDWTPLVTVARLALAVLAAGAALLMRTAALIVLGPLARLARRLEAIAGAAEAGQTTTTATTYPPTTATRRTGHGWIAPTRAGPAGSVIVA
jgi:hypothetical protein